MVTTRVIEALTRPPVVEEAWTAPVQSAVPAGKRTRVSPGDAKVPRTLRVTCVFGAMVEGRNPTSGGEGEKRGGGGGGGDGSGGDGGGGRPTEMGGGGEMVTGGKPTEMGGGGEMVTGGTPTEMGGGGEAAKTGRGGGGERATGGDIGGGMVYGGRGGAGGDGGAGGASKCTSSAGCCATVAQAAVRMPHPLAKYGTKTQP
jgi:hypothetical protein